MRACLCVHVCTCVYVCVRDFVEEYICVCVYASVSARGCLCMPVCVRGHKHEGKYVRVHTHTPDLLEPSY